MARFKDFGAGAPEQEQEPLSFKLHEEEFHCKAQIQGKILLDLVAKSSSGDGTKSAEAISSFFGVVLVPESFERFEKLAYDPDKIITVETLAEIIGWLVSEYTDRPTERPELSLNGQ